MMACGAEDQPSTAPAFAPPAADLVPETGGKGDGALFDKDALLADHIFEDAQFMTVEEVQAFLDAPPYGGHASGLSTIDVDGVGAAQIIVNNAVAFQINPLVLLAKLQVESSLVFTAEPTSYQLAHAMGCACPDNLGCSVAQAGFGRQVACAASLFRKYLDNLESGSTVSGWKVGREKRTQDGVWIIPKTRATAALYTYTPWVLTGQGGNWLFWNVFKKYSRHVLENKAPNYHWIGGACAEDADCPYEGGRCLRAGETGFCTADCERFCPDSSGPKNAVTFCVDLGSATGAEPAGACISRCDDYLFVEGGCAEGFECIEAPRFGEPDRIEAVCWPQFE